jgi:hypothetical protein
MKALFFALMIGPVLALGTGCAEAPYSVDTGPAKAAPAAPIPTRKSAIALNDPAFIPGAVAPIPTRRPTVALNEPIIILGTADGSPALPEARTSAQ